VLAEGLLRAARGVHLLLTSREPLRAQGEWVSRLPALDSPAPSDVLSAAEALTFSAVQLFVERASAADEVFRLTDSDAPVVADICRRLDGNPLAIELAASRVRVFGARELSARLDARFALTMKGSHSALPRHHTLLATLDWSYESLSEPERIVLRRVAVFSAPFSWRSAVAVCADATISDSEAREAASDLVAKSLLVADASGDQVRYRLLELTREYARQKLLESGEQTELARRHAEHYRDIFESAEQKLRTHAPEQWLAAYRWHIDEVRAALEWAFGPRGDMSIGVALTVTSIPLWFQASLMDEYRIHLERALEKVKAELPPDPVRELKLSVALGHLLLHSIGPIPEVTRLVERALELSNGLPIPLRLHAVWAMWLTQIGHADYPAVLRLAERFGKLSAESPDPSSRLFYDRMMALPLHFLGKHRAARTHIGRVLSQPAALARFAYNPMTHVDQQVSMQTLLARIYWLEGFPEQAMTAAGECVERALGTSHATSVCHALALGACPIALWSGATDVARRWTSLLMAQATRYSLGYWESWGKAVGLALEVQDEQSRGAPPRSVPREQFGGMQADMLGTLSEEFLDAEAIRRSDAGVVGWCAPEIARAQGTLLLRRGGPKDQTVAESLFVGALESARQQGALSWELRCATSLARLRIDQARATEARDLLASVCERFTEGFHTTDLVRATTILAELKA
jgi:predicted ATPase